MSPIPKPHNFGAANDPVQERKKVAHALLDLRRRADGDEAGLWKLLREDPVVAGLVQRCIREETIGCFAELLEPSQKRTMRSPVPKRQVWLLYPANWEGHHIMPHKQNA